MIRITEANGVFTGKIENCWIRRSRTEVRRCTDDRKGKPVVGSPSCATSKGESYWEGGDIPTPPKARSTGCASASAPTTKSWKCARILGNATVRGRKRWVGREMESSSFWRTINCVGA